MQDFKSDELGAPKIVDRSTFQAELDALRIREKAHTHEGDAIATARRRLPMVEMDSSIPLIGPNGPVPLLDVPLRFLALGAVVSLAGYFQRWRQIVFAGAIVGASMTFVSVAGGLLWYEKAYQHAAVRTRRRVESEA